MKRLDSDLHIINQYIADQNYEEQRSDKLRFQKKILQDQKALIDKQTQEMNKRFGRMDISE
jgi:hypothetical protein|tara:strand:- start:3428 stop:3610 length:183 start_codon:yes stop_codon:yes gene_type:complete